MYAPTADQIQVQTLEAEIREIEIEAKLAFQFGRPMVAEILRLEAARLKQELSHMQDMYWGSNQWLLSV